MFKEARVFCVSLKAEVVDAKLLSHHVKSDSYCNVHYKGELLIFDLRERFVSTKSVAFTEDSFPEGGMF